MEIGLLLVFLCRPSYSCNTATQQLLFIVGAWLKLYGTDPKVAAPLLVDGRASAWVAVVVSHGYQIIKIIITVI